ncbi:MAG TPA: phage major capsid protein, partial [Spirochaetota bacterium]|nr:phage major capsid protein [Spirochaetota bacterium]
MAIIDRTSASALISEEVSKEIYQGVVEQSVALQLMTKLPNMSKKQYRIPVLSSLPSAYFVSGDNSAKKTSSASWANKYVTAEELAVIIPIPEAVIDDADYDIWGEIKPKIEEAFGVKIDRAIFHSEDKPSTWPDGIVDGAEVAGNYVTLGTGDDIYDDIMGEDGVLAKVEEDGYNVTGNVADLSMKAKLRGLREENGQPIFTTNMQGKTTYALDGVQMLFPLNGGVDKTKALLISGDFKQGVYSIRQELTYKLL